MATVTFFGHRDAPKRIEPTLRMALVDLIEKKNSNLFYVGNQGNFDAMVRRQLEDLAQTYPITYKIVLAYMPGKNDEPDEHTVLPEGLEAVPRRFAISRRNKWMLDQADTVVTYVTHPSSGAYQMKETAIEKGKTVIELSLRTE